LLGRISTAKIADKNKRQLSYLYVVAIVEKDSDANYLESPLRVTRHCRFHLIPGSPRNCLKDDIDIIGVEDPAFIPRAPEITGGKRQTTNRQEKPPCDP
jgi:hypothetical protein